MVQENQEAESPRGCINTTNHDERESLERMETQLTVCENALLMLTYHICGDTRKGMDRYRREAITAQNAVWDARDAYAAANLARRGEGSNPYRDDSKHCGKCSSLITPEQADDNGGLCDECLGERE